MSPRPSKKPISRLAPLPSAGMLLRVLLLTLVALWVSSPEVVGHVPPKALVVAQNVRILNIPVYPTSPTTYGPPTSVITGGIYIRSIAVDEVRDTMYWSDYHKIKKSTLNGSNINIIVNDTRDWVLGLVIDPVENKLYFTDAQKGTVEVVNTDGTGRKILITGISFVTGLIVNWITRRLSYGSNSGIVSSTFTGSGILDALPGKGLHAFGVAINGNDSICWSLAGGRRVECSDFSGDNEVAFDTAGEAMSLVVENGVAYYSTINPDKVGSIELTTGQRQIIDLGPYNGYNCYGITVLVDDLVFDPPVPATKAMQLVDGDTATCLALAQMDMYTYSASVRRWAPQPRGKCVHPGLTIRRRVPDAMKTSFTTTITGRHLVCSNSHLKVSTRQTVRSHCETAGLYRTCRLSETTAPGNGGLSSCVAKCTCDGDDCKHVTVHIPNMQETWEICEIGIG